MAKTPAGAERTEITAPNRRGTPAHAERFTKPRRTPAHAERKQGAIDNDHEREYIRRRFTGRR